jgi:uncharacterized protein YigA (DUF484 family)
MIRLPDPRHVGRTVTVDPDRYPRHIAQVLTEMGADFAAIIEVAPARGHLRTRLVDLLARLDLPHQLADRIARIDEVLALQLDDPDDVDRLEDERADLAARLDAATPLPLDRAAAELRELADLCERAHQRGRLAAWTGLADEADEVAA